MTTMKSDEMNSRLMRSLNTKAVRHLEKPKPLLLKSPPATRHSAPDVPGRALVANILDEVMASVESLAGLIISRSYSEIPTHTNFLSTKLKVFGIQLEEMYKDQLDRAFIAFRNGAKDDKLEYNTRLNLLEMVELRAMQWQVRSKSLNYYYLPKQGKFEGVNEICDVNSLQNSQHLAPGELIKPSGKYPCPTKLQGKNYCKDEVVIRNADSGKVMGIKGRRVHMIEELSETVISFQRVSPGAKERLVQITGPTEEKIILARNLIEDTIKRNASPVREVVDKDFLIGSGSSLNSSTSDDNLAQYGKYEDSAIFGSPGNYNGNYVHTLQVGLTTLILQADDFDVITEAKVCLDNHFNYSRYGVNQSDFGVQCSESDLQPQIAGLPRKRTNSEKSILKKSNTYEKQNSNTALSPMPSSGLQLAVRREYSRSYLLACSNCPASKKKPACWSRLSGEFSNLVRQTPIFFDSSLHTKKKWKLLEDSSVSVANANSSDSE